MVIMAWNKKVYHIVSKHLEWPFNLRRKLTCDMREIYSLRTVPATNSSVTKRARSADNGMIKLKPNVSRSNLLTTKIRQLASECATVFTEKKT